MKAETMRRVRRIHHYVGLFFAPAIIFFAFSGALQTVGLHEREGSGPPPAAWIVWMASVHQHQTTPNAGTRSHEHEHEAGADAGETSGHASAEEKQSFIALRLFILLLAIGLILSSSLGVVIALTNRTSRRTSLVLLASGTILPLVLLLT